MSTFNPISFKSHSEQYDQTAPIRKSGTDRKITLCQSLLGVALIIIASLALGEVMSGISAGGVIVGLLIPIIIAAVVKAAKSKTLAERLINALQNMLFTVGLVLGALAITGILPLQTVAITVLSMAIITGIFLVILKRNWVKRDDNYEYIINAQPLNSEDVRT